MSNKDLFIISVFTFITVVIWIITDAYHAWVTSTVPSPLQRAIEPLTPRLDTTIIRSLKERGQIVKAPPSFSSSEATSTPSDLISSPGGAIPASPSATINPAPSPILSVAPTGTSSSGIQ